MSEERFNLVFKGELVRGCELDASKRNIGNLFKISPDKVGNLFSGEPVVLKKNLDFATANKYRVAIKKAGCRVDVVETKADTAPAPAPAPAPEQNIQPEAVQSGALKGALSTVSVSEIATKSISRSAIVAPDLGLSDVGADLLSESERPHIESVQVDISALSVTDSGGDLLRPEEKTPFVARDINVDAISTAPVGSDVLREDEREHVVPVDVDISGISIAPAGEDLGQEKDERKPLHPDISALHLE